MNRRSSSFKTDKHQAAGSPNLRHRMARRWEPILTEAKLKEALAEKAELKLMGTELERKLLGLRARRLRSLQCVGICQMYNACTFQFFSLRVQVQIVSCGLAIERQILLNSGQPLPVLQRGFGFRRLSSECCQLATNCPLPYSIRSVYARKSDPHSTAHDNTTRTSYTLACIACCREFPVGPILHP